MKTIRALSLIKVGHKWASRGSFKETQYSILVYIITQVIHGFWLVLAYDLLEDRRTIDVTISFYANKV